MTDDSRHRDVSQLLEEFTELNASAREVLSFPVSSEDIPEKFERYVSAVDAWFSRVGADLPQVLSAPQASEFLSLHKQVISHAERASGQVAGQLKELMKKGRGIIAYTDVLPRRLGVSKPRKG